VIELFAADTPNGKKISIMLEEIDFKYKVTNVNLLEGEQFNPDFRKISPFSKIPVIVDHNNNKEAIFESGAILIYLGEKSNKINLFTKCQLKSVIGKENLESIEIEHDNKVIKNLKTDYVLGFFGLIMQLGPISNWGLNIDKKTISVDTEKFETNQKGIYAVGDICTYPGKLKLILSGFHEGALAARACFKLARPNEKYRFEFTTSSKSIKNRLGVKE